MQGSARHFMDTHLELPIKEGRPRYIGGEIHVERKGEVKATS